MAGDLPLVVIMGPTAVGKTELAIKLAQHINGEIVSADSRQVYRYMDIGTAKPTPHQQQQARHHLIDIVNPDKNLSLAEYQEMACDRINTLRHQGKIPLLVGGTGQYITAIMEGWSIPRVPPNYELRAELEAFARNHGAEALYSELAIIDPAAAQKIHPNNIRRVVRALEVYRETGEPISELQRKKAPTYKIIACGLTMDRENLYERVDKRVEQMIEAGFVNEVRHLLEMGYDRNLPSMSGLGYLELAAHILDNLPLAEAVARTKFATHDFIRRQYVWFRRHHQHIIWHNSINLDTSQFIKSIENQL